MGYLNKILNNCNQVSMLSLQAKETKLTTKQKFEIKFHIMFCKCCKNFNIQSNKIDASLHSLFKNFEKNPPTKASDELKNKLKNMLDK
jgi:hypothetical protein